MSTATADAVKVVMIGDHKFFLPFADRIPIDPEDREALRNSIREAGAVRVAVVCWKERNKAFEHWVVDGGNRVEIAAELGLSKDDLPLSLRSYDSEEDAAKDCDDLNDNRRQQNREQIQKRRAARIQRVAAARAEGQSLRTIAEGEGVSPEQVRRDLETANNGQNGEEGISVVTPVTTEPATIVGKGGRTYPAKREVKCEKCIRLKLNSPDCPQCKEAREAAAKKKTQVQFEKDRKKQEREQQKADKARQDAERKAKKDAEKAKREAAASAKKAAAQAEKDRKAAEKKAKEDAAEEAAEQAQLKDAIGHEVPDGCAEAFADVAKFEALDTLVRQLQKGIDELSGRPGGERLRRFLKPTGAEGKTINKSEHLNALKRDLNGTRPHAVCPWCLGAGKKDCKGCSGSGWVTATTWKDADDAVKARLK